MMSLQDFVYEKPTIDTEHLTLRVLTPNDIEDLKEWISDLSIYKYWGKQPSKCEKKPELLFEKQEKPTKSFHWGIVHKNDNKVIGEMWVYLIENNRMAKVAFRLSPAYQGNGFMAEALTGVVQFCFKNTELQRLWSDVHILNHASYKTMEKVGFIREGHIRQGKMVNTYCDYYLYGILKSDVMPIQ